MSSQALKTPAPGSVPMFYNSWCGYCNRLKAQMGREGIAFTEVNIEEVPEAVQFVMEANDGNQTVPTLLFPDGTSATNPSINEVKNRLSA
jgi:mycoredoxin